MLLELSSWRLPSSLPAPSSLAAAAAAACVLLFLLALLVSSLKLWRCMPLSQSTRLQIRAVLVSTILLQWPQRAAAQVTSHPNPTSLTPKPPSSSLGRRQLVQSVDTLAELRDHLHVQRTAAEIELAEGTYELAANDGFGLYISHDVIIRAAPGATVILDGQGSTSVVTIESGVVTLSGLSITGGDTGSVCCAFPRTFFLRPRRKKLP